MDDFQKCRAEEKVKPHLFAEIEGRSSNLWKEAGLSAFEEGFEDSKPWWEQQEQWLQRFKCIAPRQIATAIQLGVPAVLRGKVWYACTEAAKKRDSADKTYQELMEAQGQLEGTDAMRVIEVDAPRSGITVHKLASLKNVLCAFVTRNPDISYCQSMNFIAASLLDCCPEEAAFWVFCSIIEDILPADYYTSTIFGLRVDLRVMEHLIRRHLPLLSNHLMIKAMDLSPILMVWFLCLFINTLPSHHSHCVMDCLAHEGSAALFRAALLLLRMWEAELLSVSNIADAHSFLRAPLEVDDTELFTGDALISAMHLPWMDNLSTEIDNLRKECHVTVREDDEAHARLHGNDDPVKRLQQASNELFLSSNNPTDLGFAMHAYEVSACQFQ